MARHPNRVSPAWLPLLVIAVWLNAPAVLARSNGPGWHLLEGPAIATREAQAYFPRKAVEIRQAPGFRLSELGPEKSLTQDAAAATPEVQELARGLVYDPLAIQEYVTNYVDYVPYFGSRKGATRTYLDGAGNDVDQASLMIALLRASGYDASYVYGGMYVPRQEIANWLGVDDDPALIGQVLANGGIPYEITSDGLVLLLRVWVEATVDGTTHVFDPAFKEYEDGTRIDLSQGLGYDRATFLAAATSGATVTADSVRNLNQANIESKLVEYSMNLVSFLHQNHPNTEIEDVLGGRRIIPGTFDSLPTNLRFSRFRNDVWQDVPAEHTATVRLQMPGLDLTLDIPEIGGKRLTLTYTGGGLPRIRLDGGLLATGSSTTSGGSQTLTVSVDHPFAADGGSFADQTVTFNVKPGSTYALVSSFGEFGSKTIDTRQDKLNVALDAGLDQTDESVLGETLNIMGMTWMREVQLEASLLANLNQGIFLNHHSFGLMAQEDSYYIDVPASLWVRLQRRTDVPHSIEPFYAFMELASAMEHGVLEQLQGADQQGISTVKGIQLANAASDRIFYATAANFAQIRPQLRNYSSSRLNEFEANLQSGGWTYVLPEDGAVTLDRWSGVTYVSREQTASSLNLGFIIGGGLSGGYCTGYYSTSSSPRYYSAPYSYPQSLSRDPVDMATGAFVYDNTDLSLGKADMTPMPLAFSRSYNGDRHRVAGPLGFGWNHNLAIELEKSSDAFPALGTRKPEDAAAMLAFLHVAQDVLTAQDDALAWVVTSIGAKWVVDELLDNAMTVQVGHKSSRYIRRADGSFSPPPGSTTRLVDDGSGTFSLVERFGRVMEFNGDNRLSRIEDVDGNETLLSYTGDKLAAVAVPEFGLSLNLSYSGDNIGTVTDSVGRTISFTYDANGDLTTYTDAENNNWTFTYDGEHRLTTHTDPLGVTTVTNEYDALGKVFRQTFPRQGGTQAVYNLYFTGVRNVEEDSDGFRTVYFYDRDGRPVGEENELGFRTFRKYDVHNQVIEETDALGQTKRTVYDGNNNVIQEIDALGRATIHEYDALFRRTATIDPSGARTEFGYDANHHRTSTLDDEGNTITNTYNANGQLLSTTDGRGFSTVLTYDSLGHLHTIDVAGQGPVQYFFDAAGNLAEVVDLAGASTRFVFDKRSLVQQRTDPLGQVSTYAYDDAGRIVSVTDRNGETMTNTYTPTGELQTVTFPGSAPVGFSYDVHDRLVAMNDGLGTTTYEHDAAGQLIFSTDPHGFVVGYAHDGNGNVTELTYPDGSRVSYTYDVVNQLASMADEEGHRADYVYDEAGRVEKIENLNGSQVVYGYDGAGRLDSLDNLRADGSLLSTYRFVLDENGNRTNSSQVQPLALVLPSSTTDYTYNTEGNFLLSDGARTFGYDLEGQTTGLGSVGLSYDGRHRLTGISGTSSAIYAYDGTDRKLRAAVDGSTTYFVYDAKGRLIAEAETDGTLRRKYLYGLALQAAVDADGEVYTYHFDATANTIAVTDSNQRLTHAYEYTPYGVVAAEFETFAQPFKFGGQVGVRQDLAGLYHMSARYYDPSTGRFLSEDPAGFDSKGVNLFVYAGNNPIMNVDPLGDDWISAGLGVLGIGLFFASTPVAIIGGSIVAGASLGYNLYRYQKGEITGKEVAFDIILFRTGQVAAVAKNVHRIFRGIQTAVMAVTAVKTATDIAKTNRDQTLSRNLGKNVSQNLPGGK